MKTTLTQAIIILALFVTTIGLQAQVTIGSGEAPNAGALLDLTQGATTSKGLAMPRVKLTDTDKLFPMFDGISGTDYTQGGNNYDKTTEDANHVGLVVYNTSKCDGKFNQGIYLWDGNQWKQILDKEVLAMPAISATGITSDFTDIPSGLDARGTTIPTINLNVAFAGGNAALTPTGGYTSYANMFSTMPAWTSGTAQNLTISPDSYTLQTNKMTDADFPNITTTNPWQSRQWQLVYNVPANDCGSAVNKTITFNQTNYALKVNNEFTNSQIIYTTPTTGSFNVQGNVTWKTTITGTSGLVAITPTTGGNNLKNSTNTTTNITYTAGTGSRYNIANITFSDRESIKRFNDITVSILNCNSGQNDLSLNAWALQAGFTQTEINSVAVGGTHPKTQPNGIQLHKDQNGNIFLSGDFGTTAGRWMLNNLAAKSYASGVTHPYRTLQGPNYNTAMAYNAAYWAYPNLDYSSNPALSNIYTNNPRVGLLYTWDAATAGRGGSNGQASISEQETITTNPPKRQGICPNGWHLPSDYEWTQLEQEISSNTSHYSNIPDANETISIGTPWGGYRGTTHGQAMKDSCPTPGQTTNNDSDGASNLINNVATVKPGMNILLTGYAGGGVTVRYGYSAYLWSASGLSTGDGAARDFDFGSTAVFQGRSNRHELLAVRCKKD